MTSFSDRVYRIVSKIPKGKTMTYSEVARIAGSTRAYRAVGNILNKNYKKNIPCHRVIRSDGSIGGYNRGLSIKKRKLAQEGVV
jgi:methylated-DNA-[protein]-cysteine S-methyltransferase